MEVDKKDLDDAAAAVKSCITALRNAGVPEGAVFHALQAFAISTAVRIAGVDGGFLMIDQALIMTRDIING